MPLASVTYAIADWLFLRALGVIYLAAFVSIGMQVKGLIGRDGILPAAVFLDDLKTVLGRARFAALPTLCWFGTSDRFLQCLCWGGAALSVALTASLLYRRRADDRADAAGHGDRQLLLLQPARDRAVAAPVR